MLRTIGLAAVLVLVAATAALSNTTSASVIHGCANRHTGALRVLSGHHHCARAERAISWSRTGPQGPRGLTGATGTVNTSGFYTKTQSDGRYLALHGTADNAGELGGQPASGYVSAGFGTPLELRYINQTVGAGLDGELYPALPHGHLEAICADPATSAQLQYTFEGGATGTIQRTHGGTTTYGTSDSSLSTAMDDHVQYLVSYSTGTVADLDVWVANGPGGNNECDFKVFATIVNP